MRQSGREYKSVRELTFGEGILIVRQFVQGVQKAEKRLFPF